MKLPNESLPFLKKEIFKQMLFKLTVLRALSAGWETLKIAWRAAKKQLFLLPLLAFVFVDGGRPVRDQSSFTYIGYRGRLKTKGDLN